MRGVGMNRRKEKTLINRQLNICTDTERGSQKYELVPNTTIPKQVLGVTSALSKAQQRATLRTSVTDA